jgi:hypothetical protein
MRGRELSPLQEIERRAQQRAKEISLDVGGADGKAKLRALIDDEIDAWTADYKRGLRDFDLADPEAVAERAYRNLVGYGPLERLLVDDDVWEIMVRGSRDLPFPRSCRSQRIGDHTLLRAAERLCSPLVVQMWCSQPGRGLPLRQLRFLGSGSR